MTKLSDIQLVLLSGASQRPDSNLYPLPKSVAAAGKRASEAIESLLGMGCVEIREVFAGDIAHRIDGDLRYGAFATEIGLAVLDAGPSSEETEVDRPSRRHGSKSDAVISLLERQAGATIGELAEATGWLPHTTRAALTGLRKKGYLIQRGKRDQQTSYQIVSAE